MLKIIVNEDFLLESLSVSLVASIIATNTIQKIKDTFKFNHLVNSIISLILSYLIGMMYSITFYKPDIICSLWIGLYTMIGAERLYKAFNGYFGLNSANEKEDKL